MRVKFRVISYEEVEIPDDEANNPLIIDKLKEGCFADSEELMDWLLDNNIEHDYDLSAECIVGNGTPYKRLNADYILVNDEPI